MSIPAASGFMIGRATFLFGFLCFFDISSSAINCREEAVRVVKNRHSPNRDRFARLSADSRHHCFDHATQGHTGRTGSKRAPLQTRPTAPGPSAPLWRLSSFRVSPMNHMRSRAMAFRIKRSKVPWRRSHFNAAMHTSSFYWYSRREYIEVQGLGDALKHDSHLLISPSNFSRSVKTE